MQFWCFIEFEGVINS